MPALAADQARQGELVPADREMGSLADRARHLLAGGGPPRRDLLERVTTASKVSMVEAWRALKSAPAPAPADRPIGRPAARRSPSACAASPRAPRAAPSAVEPTTRRPIIDEEAWPRAQAFTSCAKSATTSPSDLEVDRHGRAAELGMGRRAGVGVRQPAEARNVGGELEDAAVVDLVQHPTCKLADGAAFRPNIGRVIRFLRPGLHPCAVAGCGGAPGHFRAR